MITHLEPDILECEVTWTLGSITMNKASGGDGIPAELFKTLKDDVVEVLHSICHKFGRFSSGHRTGKGQFSFQSQKKGNAKDCSNYCIIALISHTSMEKALAPHSSTLAWKIPWIEKPGRLQSMGSLRVRHD